MTHTLHYASSAQLQIRNISQGVIPYRFLPVISDTLKKKLLFWCGDIAFFHLEMSPAVEYAFRFRKRFRNDPLEVKVKVK